MSGTTRLEGRDISTHWLVVLEGIPSVWYSQTTPTGLPSTIESRLMVSAFPGVVAVGSSAKEMDTSTAITTGGGVSVSLLITEDDDNNVADLLRFGPDGSDYTATLAADVAQEAATTFVEVEEDISGWPLAGLIHIGLETIRYTSRAVASPWRFSSLTRGYRDSRIESHKVTDLVAPAVYYNALAWKGRGARIFYAATSVGEAPSASDWVEYVRGYLREMPRLDDDGVTVTLSVVPWTAPLGRTIGGPEDTTGLVEGEHVFDGVVAGHYRGWTQGWAEGAAYDANVSAATVGGAAVYSIGNCPWSAHDDIFDVSLTTDFDKRGPVLYGRGNGPLFLDSNPAVAYVDAAASGGQDPASCSVGLDNPGSPLTAGTSAGGRVWNAPVPNTRQDHTDTPGTPTAWSWPEEVVSYLNDAWTPEDTQGADGLWADLRIEPQGNDGGPVLRAQLNCIENQDALDLVVGIPDAYALWYGLSLADPEAMVPVRTSDEPAAGERASVWPSRELKVTQARTDEYSGWDEWPIAGWSSAFWQTGETYIHVTEDIFPGHGDPFYINVRGEDRDGSTIDQDMLITDVELASTVASGASGYLLTVEPGLKWSYRSFGIWPGRKPVTVRPVAAWHAQPPGFASGIPQGDPRRIMLELLLSSEGGAFSGGFIDATYAADYNVQPYGAGLTDADVDVPSFERFPLPGGAVNESKRFSITDETTVADELSSIAVLIGATITIGLDEETGRRKLRLVRLGLPTSQESVKSITDGDFLVSGRPRGLADEKTENVLEVQSNFDRFEREFRQTTRLVDRASVQRTGRTDVQSVEAPWLHIQTRSPGDAISALLPVARERWAVYGWPRRIIEGDIPHDQAVRLDVGSVVTLTCSDIRDRFGAKGLSGKTAQVLAITHDPWQKTSRIRCVWYDVNTSGWAPAMSVATISAVDAVTVAANAYAPTADTLTGESRQDSDYFAAGDIVRIVPVEDYASAVVRTIQSVSGATVTFTAAHGFAGVGNGLTIRPSAYPDNPGTLSEYVHMADDGGILDSSDPAYVYA